MVEHASKNFITHSLVFVIMGKTTLHVDCIGMCFIKDLLETVQEELPDHLYSLQEIFNKTHANAAKSCQTTCTVSKRSSIKHMPMQLRATRPLVQSPRDLQ